ncbi:methylmalonyl-CoA mutase [Kitasatospora aureofaciens]|uniref:acyl-CoA mutase large subunit family protein n=1 Tax=Kitasatospora aureofaciens TaxID=1894 RepID=UPI001C44A3D0|nr:methylmalonyl-CoA mutase family protein [Kitasatospora aureofaciens]MBV6696690.1 methylmalonyl-CoA mutase [Kitasatospora aureofaciens]
MTEPAFTDSGLPVEPCYGPADLPAAHDAERPGQAPFTRGIRPGMYRERPWAIRQLAGYSTADHTNRRLRMLLDSGATAINTVFDFPTNRGYDSDEAIARADAGQGGVAIDSVEDMLALYDGIPLDRVSVSLVLSHPVAAGAVFALYLAAAERRGYRFGDLRGTLQNDFMMETVVLTAPSVLEPGFSFQLSTDVVEFCLQQVPRWNAISYAGYNYREAGADAVHEVALVVAHAVATAEEMVRRGHPVDSFAGRLTAFFSADNDFFEEIAKYRAARRVYARIFGERLKAAEARSLMLRYHVQTAGSALTAQQPLNNIARAAYQGLAAVLGGAQSLHISAYDEALSIPSEQAALTALHTQLILRHETGVDRTADPLAGSYYVEHLTAEIDRRVTGLLEQIDAMGGLVAAVDQGWVHQQLLGRAYERQLELDAGSRTLVGVNRFQDEDEPLRIEPFRVPATIEAQRRRLARLRAARDRDRVRSALEEVRAAAVAGRNTMPGLLDAARAGATLGECCEVFRDLYGGWRQPLIG